MACVGKAPEFDSAVESFGAYARRLEQYFIANEIKEDQVIRRRAIFLSVVGAQTYGLLEDLIAPSSVDEVSYCNLVKVLSEHFEPQTSEIVARSRFHSCCRNEDETVSSYAARLRKLAKPCQFGQNVLEEMLRDRLVCGIKHQRLQSRLLSETNLTLKTALEMAQAHESAAASAAELSGAGQPAAATHRIGGARGAAARRGDGGARRGAGRGAPRTDAKQRDALTCSRCLSKRHRPEDCPFRSKQCYACGSRGHVRAVCNQWSRRQLRQLSVEGCPDTPAADEEGGTDPDAEVQAVDSGDRRGAGDDAYEMFSVRPGAAGIRQPLMVNVELDDRPVEMELDASSTRSRPGSLTEQSSCCWTSLGRMTASGEPPSCVRWRAWASPAASSGGSGPSSRTGALVSGGAPLVRTPGCSRRDYLRAACWPRCSG